MNKTEDAFKELFLETFCEPCFSLMSLYWLLEELDVEKVDLVSCTTLCYVPALWYQSKTFFFGTGA
jgi:hypothetical protein